MNSKTTLDIALAGGAVSSPAWLSVANEWGALGLVIIGIVLGGMRIVVAYHDIRTRR